MIDKKEYRLNNLVWVEGHNTYDKITNIDLDDDYVGMSMLNCNCHIDMLHPISLSPEWLDKCGFEKIQEGDMAYPTIYWKDYTRVLVTTCFELQSRDEGEWRLLEGNINVPLYYVHELQNLWYSIVGTELVIDQTKNG